MRMAFVIATCAAVLGGCATSTDGSGSTGSMTQEEEFRTRVVGATLVNERGSVVYAPDGTFEGTSDGEELVGRWQFQNGQYCVVGRVGGRSFPAECQRLVFDGDEVTFDGRDFDVTYTIQS